MKLVAVLALLAFSVPALADVQNGFTVFKSSGYTPPEYTYKFACQIDSAGKLRVELDKYKKVGDQWAWYIARKEERTLAPSAMKELFELLKNAALIDAYKLPAACDIGTTVFQGVLEDKDITLDSYLDCQAHYVNPTNAAALLVKRLTAECQPPR